MALLYWNNIHFAGAVIMSSIQPPGQVTRQANALLTETSPYLQQHAYNPVHWYPWGEAALQKAREENKPILLSIGYSACHWCHVMAHECFENEAIAELMNALFVNIKVDREERPDLDKIYQLSYQLLNQRAGGWPLNMFLSADDQTPFYGGTYFPPQAGRGMPGFVDVLRSVSRFVQERAEDIQNQNTVLKNYLKQMSADKPDENVVLDESVLKQAREQLEAGYDHDYGGFGEAPKFPHPTHLERLLRHWASLRDTGISDESALRMVVTTLQAMGRGGLYDQLGGGFCRYSVDNAWRIPHFEKMLYDNGPLLTLYADTCVATGDKDFRRISEETAQWVMREMQSPQGGYYSTLDADSEGEEGRFYVWSRTDIKCLLTDPEFAVTEAYYGLNEAPNFEGGWHLNIHRWPARIAEELSVNLIDVENRLTSARQKLLVEREKRIRPGRDEKILTSWNGLMIKGMATTGWRLNRPDMIRSAERALEFVQATLWQEGRLLATYKDSKAHLMAYLDDYVFLIDGIIALLQARWRSGDLHFAVELMEAVLNYFSAQDGGFYFTADDHEQLIQRPRPWQDDATPSGNGVAAQVLLRLGYLLGEPRYLEAAENTLKAAWSNIQQLPHAHNALLTALEDYLGPVETVIIRGEARDLSAWAGEFASEYTPRRMIFFIANDVDDLPAGLVDYQPADSGILAYVCRYPECYAPVSSLPELRQRLSTGHTTAIG